MPSENDKIDDSQIPPELDRGLGFAFGGKQVSSQDPSPAPSILKRVGEVTGSKPSVYLREIDEADHGGMLKPLVAGDGIAQETGKYTMYGMLGEGGVGVVYKGHDADLGRDVAIKVVRERYQKDPAILHRFVEEAQLGSQLQHPGIVPVYELGMTGGRPFFAMKMVKGVTLAKKLAERSSLTTDRRMFLSIFESICQTMSYVHTRGVVHRDLKPANVMIGAFGEVQIVDWGMGKVLQSGGVADEKLAVERQAAVSVIETARSVDSGTQSVIGSIMGTPAYMPPEQARGDVDAMDERSDVFALGAILCEILTGKPPYVGGRDDLIGMASMAKLDDAHARIAGCGADPDLVDLLTRCLMPAPAARPQSASAVAQVVREHLATAEQRVHSAAVRAMSMRRNQKLGIAVLVVIAVCLAASLMFWREAETQRDLAQQAAVVASTAEKTAWAAKEDEKSARGLEQIARQTAEANLVNFNRLSNVVRLESARVSEKSLYPAWPEKVSAIREWLSVEARQLRDAVPDLRATLTSLRVEGLPRQSRNAVGQEIAQSTAWQFEDESKQFLHDTLSDLVVDLKVFASTTVAAVEQRLEWAMSVEDAAVTRYRDRWDEARLAILVADGIESSKLYAASRFELLPQVGLVPIGMNPVTKLWEFYHLRSAWDGSSDPATIAIPKHRADGSIKVTGDTGIVFVLMPGGAFMMGGQGEDATGPLFDPHTDQYDKPPHEVVLQPFFLARHELTQGQWLRLWCGDERMRLPSRYLAGKTWGPRVLIANAGAAQAVDGGQVVTLDATGSTDPESKPMTYTWSQTNGPLVTLSDASSPQPTWTAPKGLTNARFIFEVSVSDGVNTAIDVVAITVNPDSDAPPLDVEVAPRHRPQVQTITLSHPVEMVSWAVSSDLMADHGLMLPLSSQWEYGCRAGSTTIWWSGNDASDLVDIANVLDQRAARAIQGSGRAEPFDDGYVLHASVGSFKANRFGLYDAHGNVREWCRDKVGLNDRVERGGSFGTSALHARSAWPNSERESYRGGGLGLRPARALRLPE